MRNKSPSRSLGKITRTRGRREACFHSSAAEEEQKVGRAKLVLFVNA